MNVIKKELFFLCFQQYNKTYCSDHSFDLVFRAKQNILTGCIHFDPNGYIDSYLSHYYSFEFIRQLKTENPYINIEISLDEQMYNKSIQTIVILFFECNENYVLSYIEFDYFLKYISTCKSIEEIQIEIESSIAFGYSLSHGQNVQWHQNKSYSLSRFIIRTNSKSIIDTWFMRYEFCI